MKKKRKMVKRYPPLLTGREIAHAIDAEGALERIERWMREGMVELLFDIRVQVAAGASLLEVIRDIVHPPKEPISKKSAKKRKVK